MPEMIEGLEHSADILRVFDKIDAVHEDIKEIKIQTTKTNGRVTALERWQNRIIGGGVSLSVAFAIIKVFIPLFVK